MYIDNISFHLEELEQKSFVLMQCALVYMSWVILPAILQICRDESEY
jgi:hypothetical protein